jgi:rhodanese-related sulfurtransferase
LNLATSDRNSSLKKVFLEAVIVAVAGAALAFAANAISPRGLSLSRNYFPSDQATPLQIHRTKPITSTTNGPSEPELIAAHFKEKGLQLVDSDKALQLFHDPRIHEGSIIFIDVHSERDYQEKHIPGAYQFDYYHPEATIGAVLAACQTAGQIVIYCNGGNCEDSELTAIMLRDEAHIPGEKLFIYSGGITEWTQKGFPLETGARNSGKLLNQAQK